MLFRSFGKERKSESLFVAVFVKEQIALLRSFSKDRYLLLFLKRAKKKITKERKSDCPTLSRTEPWSVMLYLYSTETPDSAELMLFEPFYGLKYNKLVQWFHHDCLYFNHYLPHFIHIIFLPGVVSSSCPLLFPVPGGLPRLGADLRGQTSACFGGSSAV